MEEVTFNCDRCGEEVVGAFDEFFTAGYYNVGADSAWHRFGRAGEARICDPCMHTDPEYARIYHYDAEAAAYREKHGY